jgi:5'-deoxynucleotidase YfbR-like HD superfamily hydrolase
MSDDTKDRGDWSQTYTDLMFYPKDPRPEDIDIRDIAHGLAYSSRFNGQTNRYYSIAEHCVHVSYECDEADALEGLMHDAAEAYVGDVVTSVKRHLPGFYEIEDAIEQVIAAKYKLRRPWPESVKRADIAVLIAEKRDLFAKNLVWKKHANTKPMSRTVNCWNDSTAYDHFLKRYAQLKGLDLVGVMVHGDAVLL